MPTVINRVSYVDIDTGEKIKHDDKRNLQDYTVLKTIKKIWYNGSRTKQFREFTKICKHNRYKQQELFSNQNAS